LEFGDCELLSDDIAPLAQLSRLQTLVIGVNRIRDLSPFACLQITDLNIRHLHNVDVSPLKNIPLKRLSIPVWVNNLEVLVESEKLTDLHVMTSIEYYISILLGSHIVNLTIDYYKYSPYRGIDELTNMPKLKNIYIKTQAWDRCNSIQKIPIELYHMLQSHGINISIQ